MGELIEAGSLIARAPGNDFSSDFSLISSLLCLLALGVYALFQGGTSNNDDDDSSPGGGLMQPIS